MGKTGWYRVTKKKKKSVPLSPGSDGELATEHDPNACLFCHSKEEDDNRFGKLLSKDGIVTHYFCMLFASGLGQNGRTEAEGVLGFLTKDINRELNRGQRFRCIYCRRKGATIGCCMKSCRCVFHFNCGLENEALNQFFGNFNSYCGSHRLKQTVPCSDRLSFHGTASTSCAICMCSVEARASVSTLRTPCCKNSWYHRECIQNQALSAGLHFFKCPLCNNKDNFQKEMVTHGIYIPDQDASWEREDNAFHELLDRHNRCDVKHCRTNKGRKYRSKGKYDIALCDLCGSQGTHLVCSNLESVDSPWECQDCMKMHQQVQKRLATLPKPSAKPKSSVNKNSNYTSYLEQKGRSSYRPSTAFPAKKGVKRKCSAAAGRPSAKRCRIMECSIKLTCIDKQLENGEIDGERCLLSPGRTSVKFHPKENVTSTCNRQLSEDMKNSKLDLLRFRKKLEAIKQQRLVMEKANTTSPSKTITSPITGQKIETDNIRRKIQSLNNSSISPLSGDRTESGSGVKSSGLTSLKKCIPSEFFYTSPFPRKTSILAADSSMRSSPCTPKSTVSFGDRTPACTSFTFSINTPSSSSLSDFTPKSAANYYIKKRQRSSAGSPLFIPTSGSSLQQYSQSSSKSPGPIASSSLWKSSKYKVVSPADASSTPKMDCRTPQVEVSHAGTHVVHSECNSEQINRNIVRNKGNKAWSTCTLHSKSQLSQVHSTSRQSVKRLDFLDQIDKLSKERLSPNVSASPGSPANQSVSDSATSFQAVGSPFRLYPSQVPLSKPEFDRLWTSSSSGSETETVSHKRTSRKHGKKGWYYLPKGEHMVAKHSFSKPCQSGLRSTSTIKPHTNVRLRRRFRPTELSPSPGRNQLTLADTRWSTT